MEGKKDFGPMLMGLPPVQSAEDMAADKAKRDLADDLMIAQMRGQIVLQLATAAKLFAEAFVILKASERPSKTVSVLAEQARRMGEILKDD